MHCWNFVSSNLISLEAIFWDEKMLVFGIGFSHLSWVQPIKGYLKIAMTFSLSVFCSQKKNLEKQTNNLKIFLLFDFHSIRMLFSVFSLLKVRFKQKFLRKIELFFCRLPKTDFFLCCHENLSIFIILLFWQNLLFQFNFASFFLFFFYCFFCVSLSKY